MAIKGLSGLIFLVLGFCILNYGTKLETAVSASINQKSGISHDLDGLDIRILTITIILSLIFLGRALIDSLYAWNLIQARLESPFVNLIAVFLTELLPSLLIT
jgi:hypothetical protein